MSDNPELQALFQAIKKDDKEKTRQLIMNKSLTSQRYRDPSVKFEGESELDAYKFLGAYIGPTTALQLAILTGNDAAAKDIIDATFKDDLDIPFGGNNTALHLATFLGARDIVKLLLERGASKTIKNSKGFAPIDIVDDPDMRKLFE